MLTLTRYLNIGGYLILAGVALVLLIRDKDKARSVMLWLVAWASTWWALFYAALAFGWLSMVEHGSIVVMASRVLHWFTWLVFGLFMYALFLSKRVEERHLDS